MEKTHSRKLLAVPWRKLSLQPSFRGQESVQPQWWMFM